VISENSYLIAIFKSVSHAMKAERILIEAGIPHKLIPVPKKISADCGVCLRFLPEHKDAVLGAIGYSVEVSDVIEL
jgi:hypothetical protein